MLVVLALAACSSTTPTPAPDNTPCQHRDADDNSLCDKCREEYTDGEDGTDDHICVFDQKNTVEKYLVSPAGCESGAKYTYSCTCGAVGEEVFTIGEPLGHTEELIEGKAPSWTEAGLTEGKQCLICGEILTAAHEIAALGHSFSGEKCSVCGAINEEGSIGLEYRVFGDGSCYVSGIGTCTDTDIVIPAKCPDGHDVTGIFAGAFKGCESIWSVFISDGITTIGTEAFYACSNILKVTVPSS